MVPPELCSHSTVFSASQCHFSGFQCTFQDFQNHLKTMNRYLEHLKAVTLHCSKPFSKYGLPLLFLCYFVFFFVRVFFSYYSIIFIRSLLHPRIYIYIHAYTYLSQSTWIHNICVYIYIYIHTHIISTPSSSSRPSGPQRRRAFSRRRPSRPRPSKDKRASNMTLIVYVTNS